jgi:hypothetical protein
MPLNPDDIVISDDLQTLKLDVGDTFRGLLIDIDEAPHLNFDTGEPELDRQGNPKTKWVVRLRRAGATDPAEDVKWWTQNQVKFVVRAAIAEHVKSGTYRGAEVGIERKPDGEPRQKGYRGPADYRFVVITPGPVGWVDPLAQPAINIDLGEEAF